MYSPHTWGWTGPGHVLDDRQQAYSPHTWGWTATAHRFFVGSHLYSPHTWGWTEVARIVAPSSPGIPRTRGDGPGTDTNYYAAMVPIPHTLGEGPAT